MNEQAFSLRSLANPSDWKRAVLEAGARGPTVVDADSGTLHVLRYRDIERLLGESRLHGVGLSVFDAMGITHGPLREWYGSLMFTNEGRVHARLRQLVSKAFTPRAVERQRARVAAQVERQLAPFRAGEGGDLVAALAHVPMHAMCGLLGVPATAVPDFIAWVDALSPVFGWMEPAVIERAEDAISQLLAYVRDLAEERSRVPADDLITSLLLAEHEGDRLTREETVTMVANLLVGGHDTTASQIGCTSLTLLVQRHALGAIRSDPSRLAAIVSETIRYEPSLSGAPRTVVASLEIGGIERPAGTMVILNTLAASHDPGVWRDADNFVLGRFEQPDAPRLLSFGGGPHYCLGAALARVTLEETVRGIAGLDVELAADPDHLEWVQVLGRSPTRLPVRGPASSAEDWSSLSPAH